MVIKSTGSEDFWQIVVVFSAIKSAIPSLFNSPEVLSSASDRAKLFPKNFSKNSGPDCIPVVFLKSCEPEV